MGIRRGIRKGVKGLEGVKGVCKKGIRGVEGVVRIQNASLLTLHLQLSTDPKDLYCG